MQEFLSNLMQEASLDYFSSFEFIETAKNRRIPKSHCNKKKINCTIEKWQPIQKDHILNESSSAGKG